jgi:ligand-binding sensor domain-containing protein
VRPAALFVVTVTCTVLPAAASAQTTTPAAPPPNPADPHPVHDLSVQISAYVRCVFQDRDGDLWFGTNGDGVCRYDGKQLVFIGVKDGLAGSMVREIVQTGDGAMWFTTEGGVGRYHEGAITNYTAADGLPSDDTWSMMLDSTGTLWVGTVEGVARWVGADPTIHTTGRTRAEKPFVPFPLPRAEGDTSEARFDPRLVWSFFEDTHGNMWFGTDGGGVRKFGGRTFTTYTKKDGLGGNQIRCIRGDRHGRIWSGGDDIGVTCFDGKTFRHYTTKDGLANDRVFVIYEDKAGNLWFSTLGEGVTRYDGTSFTAYRQLGNLPRTHVQDILQDKDGTLWFGCSGGLFRFDGTTFINVTKDGPWR